MDGMLDPVCGLPRSPEAPETTLAPPVPPPPAETRRASGLLGRTLLVTLVIFLGLGHGARTALGSGAPPRPAERPDVAAPPVQPSAPPTREPDWRRGHFYRPAGSTATRPESELRPRIWLPKRLPGPRYARACPGERPTRGC